MCSSYLQQIQQQTGKQKVTNMIHSQLHFVALLCQSVWAAHDARIVDENVQLILLLFETK